MGVLQVRQAWKVPGSAYLFERVLRLTAQPLLSFSAEPPLPEQAEGRCNAGSPKRNHPGEEQSGYLNYER